MTRIVLEDITKNESAWIAQKVDTIGSGDIACIAGADDYKTPLKLWAVKTRKEAPDPENDHMWWGKVMEPAIAQLGARRLGLKIRHGNTLFGHDEISWATATPDYFASQLVGVESTSLQVNNEEVMSNFEPVFGQDTILECKNVSYRARQKWEDDTPLAPRIQVMWQMGICGISRAFITPLIGGDIFEFKARVVDFDPRIFNQLVEMADKFMWCVNNDIPPAPRADDVKLVEKIIGDIEDKTKILPADLLPKFAEYATVSAELKAGNAIVKALEEKQKGIRAGLRLAMGNAKHAVCGPFKAKATLVEVGAQARKAYDFVKFSVKEGEQDSID